MTVVSAYFGRGSQTLLKAMRKVRVWGLCNRMTGNSRDGCLRRVARLVSVGERGGAAVGAGTAGVLWGLVVVGWGGGLWLEGRVRVVLIGGVLLARGG